MTWRDVMKKIAKWITEHKVWIVVTAFLLLVPSVFGMMKTKINYDILVYLPGDIETIKGQNILTEDFHLGAFSFVIMDKMDSDTMLTMEKEIKKIESVNLVFSDQDILGSAFPAEWIPDEVYHHLEKEDSRLMLVTFTESISSEETLNAVSQIREITEEHAKIGGMSAMVLDTMDISNDEMLLYIVIAVILCIVVLLFATDSYIMPLLLLGNIGLAILYNMGSNIFLGEISYITKAISAVLQLGVTTDFSIFLYHKYEFQKQTLNKEEAMQEAICETFKSVIGSSLTTIAGFLALCSMNLTLGRDIGIVMAKGVIFGLISVLTIFPCLILVFDKVVEKTKHKNIFPTFKRIQKFSIKHYILSFLVFLSLLVPIIYGNNRVKVYYNLDKSLPETLLSSVANKALKEEYEIVSPAVVLLDENLNYEDLNSLIQELKELDGISLVLSPKELTMGIPAFMLPDEVSKFLSSNGYQLMIVNSLYEIATTELNEQIGAMDTIVKKYDSHAIVAGEGPLMKDLVKISDEDFKNVNYTSILVIFVIMLFTLKSISLPIILVIAIEAAIFANMSVAYYTGATLPFIASIVIGTIQLGATIDYAILMATTYLEERKKTSEKKVAMKNTLEHTVPSIIVSALCFFAATVGVSLISKIDMIAAICKLLSRGSVISMLVVIFILPSLLLIFDKLIQKSTLK